MRDAKTMRTNGGREGEREERRMRVEETATTEERREGGREGGRMYDKDSDSRELAEARSRQ